MKQLLVLLTGVVLFFSSCSSYSASGAVVGGQFGHVIGSAIGGISGGWRGHHMGSLIGTVGGIAAGAAIGAAVEQSAENGIRHAKEEHYGYGRNDNQNTAGDVVASAPSGRVDDRIVFDDNNRHANRHAVHHGATRSISLSQLTQKPAIELRNAVFYDSNHDGVITRGEECRVHFEVMNNTSSPIYDLYPIVKEVTENRHVKVSPNLRVESIAPHQGIRYTATIAADKRLKDGEIIIRVSVAQGQHVIDSQTQEFRVVTRKKSNN